MKTFWLVGQALKTVRDQRLYRVQYWSFDQYCRQCWGMGRQYAYRVIEDAGVLQDLSPIGDRSLPTHESQVRPLTRLKDPEERHTVWREVLAAAPETPVTAARVRTAVEPRLPPPPAPAGAEPYILTLARQYAKASPSETRGLAPQLLEAHQVADLPSLGGREDVGIPELSDPADAALLLPELDDPISSLHSNPGQTQELTAGG